MTVINNTTKSQQVNVNLLCHDYGADPYSFLVRKCKDVPKSLQLVLPKTKGGCIGILISEDFFEYNEGPHQLHNQFSHFSRIISGVCEQSIDTMLCQSYVPHEVHTTRKA